MKNILVTGARGFIGRNLVAHLAVRDDVRLLQYDVDDEGQKLIEWSRAADIVFHLAGVNRSEDEDEFLEGNVGFTKTLCDLLRRREEPPKLVMTSSIKAGENSPYGQSKLLAEGALEGFARETDAAVSIYRLKNVFGKWCRPNYNSVTATFCHNIARELPITVSDPNHVIELVYIDDVVAALTSEIASPRRSPTDHHVDDSIPSYRISLGELAARIQAFHRIRSTLEIPDLDDRFNKCLYGTFLTYRPLDALEYGLDIKSDQRGSLAEFIKSDHAGQIFVSRTRPGVARGNHYHHTKSEKFLVIEGEGLIRMRALDGTDVTEFRVRGDQYRVVDIPPGVTHSIQNVGDSVLITMFWASEVYNPNDPDTYYLEI